MVEVATVPEGTTQEAEGRSAHSVLVEARAVEYFIGSGVDTIHIVNDVSLTVERGTFFAIVGPSGCGKTTFLNLVAGVDVPSSGVVLVGGVKPAPSPDRVMYAFARDALLPWRTAAQNISLPLEMMGLPTNEIAERVRELLEKVGLSGMGGRYRAELSQGMRQRVALARSLAPRPELLVMDEPFAALDAQTRVAMQNVLLDLLETEQATVLFVTHDLAEAITLADQVALFSQRPCGVRDLVDIPLERPRDSGRLRIDPRFHEIYDRLWDTLRQEVEGLDGLEGEHAND